MKFDFNKDLLGLNGEPIKNSNMGKILAQALSESTRGDALKFWHIATKLYTGEAIELDPSDEKTIKDFISTNEQLPVITKAQMLMVFYKKD